MDRALQNAIARRDGATVRIAEIDRDIQSLRAARARVAADAETTDVFIRIWYVMAGLQPPVDREQITIVDHGPPPPRRTKNPDRDFVVENCMAIIDEAGEPLGRHELFESLTARGIVINGKDPEMVLSTMLWRSQDRIVRLPKHGYWLADQEYRPAIYYPALEVSLGVAARDAEEGAEPDHE